MNERRTTQRQPQLKSGRIIVNIQTSMIECTVRNTSAGGAGLIVPDGVLLPAAFALRVQGERRACAVAWRRANRLGVKFH